MEDNISPWNIDPEMSEYSTERDHKMVQSFVLPTTPPLKRFPYRSSSYKPSKQPPQPRPIANSRSQVRIRITSHQQKPQMQGLKEISKKRQKKASTGSLLKLQIKNLENDQLYFSQHFKTTTEKVIHSPKYLSSSHSTKVPKSKEARLLHGSPNRQTKERLINQNRLYNRMLQDEVILLNQKMENIFQTQRANHRIQININRFIDNSSQKSKQRKAILITAVPEKRPF